MGIQEPGTPFGSHQMVFQEVTVDCMGQWPWGPGKSVGVGETLGPVNRPHDWMQGLRAIGTRGWFGVAVTAWKHLTGPHGPCADHRDVSPAPWVPSHRNALLVALTVLARPIPLLTTPSPPSPFPFLKRETITCW